MIAMLFATDSRVDAFRDVRRVKAVEFRGTKLLSKAELVKDVETRVEADGIVIDVDGLRSHLDKFLMVQSYRVFEDGDRLVVQVTENEPEWVLAVKKEDGIVPFEVDAKLRVISVHRVHAVDKPLIIVAPEEIGSGRLSERLRKAIAFMNEMKTTAPALMRELEEIDLTALPRARVMLKQRRTRFNLRFSAGGFAVLSCVAGYLDSRRSYPESAEIYAGRAAMK